jgi:hypothetical protein
VSPLQAGGTVKPIRFLLFVLFAMPFLGVAWGQTTPTTSAAASTTQAVVPQLIKFSGVLTDLAGKPVTYHVDVTFSIYKGQTAGQALWYETQNVTPDAEGHYTVLLGAMHDGGLPTDLFTSGEAHWLGVQVENLPEEPRVLLVSVPYALKAGDAETLGGKPASDYLLSSQSASSSTTLLTASPTGGGTGKTTSQTSSTNAAISNASMTGTQNYIPVFTDNSGSLGNSVMYQNGSNIGIGTTSPSHELDVSSGDIGNSTGAVTISAGGTNQNITLTPSGTGSVIVGSPSLPNTDRPFVTPEIALSQSATESYLEEFNENNSSGATIGQFYWIMHGTGTNDPTGPGGLTFKDGDTWNDIFRVYHSGALQFLAEGTNQNIVLTPSGGGYTILNGDVGIGTSNPTAALEVNGTAKFDQAVTFASGQSFTGNGSGLTSINPANIASGTAGISITGNAATATTATNATYLGGLSASSFLPVSGGNVSGSLLVGGTNAQGQNMVLEVQNTPGTDALTINSSGTVGLGTGTGTHITTASPNTDFAGQISISNTTSGTHAFATAFANTPVCVASPTSSMGSVTWNVGVSATQLSIILSGAATVTFNYICVGNPN